MPSYQVSVAPGFTLASVSSQSAAQVVALWLVSPHPSPSTSVQLSQMSPSPSPSLSAWLGFASSGQLSSPSAMPSPSLSSRSMATTSATMRESLVVSVMSISISPASA